MGGKFLLQPECGGVINEIVVRHGLIKCFDAFMRRALHADENARNLTLSGMPFPNDVVDSLPAAQIQVTNTKIGARGRDKRATKCLKQLV